METPQTLPGPVCSRFAIIFNIGMEPKMRITICEDKIELGRQAAAMGRHYIKTTIKEKGFANVAFVTGTSQIGLLENLRKAEIEWDKVNAFLLDEFIGLKDGHKASSETFLKENFLNYIPAIGSFHPISRDKNTSATLKKMNKLMKDYPLDVAFICIGENGHLAFNDPPADLDVTDPYILVDLERRSRRQQVGEGWFKSIDDVPSEAITMSIKEILSAKNIICACPEQRKAKAVAMCIYDDIGPAAPCAALKRKNNCDVFLDRQSSCLILGDKRNF